MFAFLTDESTRRTICLFNTENLELFKIFKSKLGIIAIFGTVN